MASNPSVQAWGGRLTALVGKVQSAASTAVFGEANTLRDAMFADAYSDGGEYIRNHTRIVQSHDGLVATIVVDGVAAGADAHAAAGKPPDPDFNLGLELEYGSQGVSAKPFFHTTKRANASSIQARIAQALIAALIDPASDTGVEAVAGDNSNPTYEPGDAGHSADVRLG